MTLSTQHLPGPLPRHRCGHAEAAEHTAMLYLVLDALQAVPQQMFMVSASLPSSTSLLALDRLQMQQLHIRICSSSI